MWVEKGTWMQATRMSPKMWIMPGRDGVYDNMHRGKWTCNVDKRASILIYGIKC